MLTEYFESRVHRGVLDYLLQKQLFETAKVLAKETNLEVFSDIELFQEVYEILNKFKSLSEQVAISREGSSSKHQDSMACKKSMNDCIETALSWCNTYKTKLQGMDSQLEFHLRIMGYI